MGERTSRPRHFASYMHAWVWCCVCARVNTMHVKHTHMHVRFNMRACPHARTRPDLNPCRNLLALVRVSVRGLCKHARA